MLSVRNLQFPGMAPVSFELATGECLVIQGPSGSGKSLLLRALADLDPNEGEVRLDKQLREDLPATHWRQLLAYLPAESGWWADHVGTHFSDWLAALPLLNKLRLSAECGDWLVRNLSTGEKQRLALIRTLILNPRVLLLDEPTSALDQSNTRLIETMVEECLSRGLGALWVTHDNAQAKRLAQRCLMIANGHAREVLL